MPQNELTHSSRRNSVKLSVSYKLYIWFILVGFYVTSTIEGYSMANTLYTCM